MWTKPKKSDLLDASELRRAIIDLLSRRDYSRLELSRKFKERCADPDVLEQLLDDFSERNWQSDSRFAESFVNARFSRGLGPIRLKQELREKGIDSQTINLTFEACEHDWFSAALDVAQKKHQRLKADDPNSKQKLYRFLAYRGFTSDQISYAMDEL